MKKFIPVLLLATLIMAGCTKNFDSINTNPNSPDKVTNVGLLLPSAMRNAFNSNFYNSYARGSIAANLLASDYASNFSNWARSDASSYFLWNYYDYIRDLNDVLKLADEQSLNNYKGIALVLRSWMFQCVTDMYGPIPFREAANAKISGINTPKYEQQDAVYAGLLSDLEEAVTLLGSSEETVVGDILYSGNINNWKKFASAMILRLALRQSKQVDPSAIMKNIVEHADKYPLFTSYADQASLAYLNDRPENNSPFYNSGNGESGTKVTKQLVGYFKAMNDPRLYVYALPTPASSAQDANGNRPDPSLFKYEGDLNGIGAFPSPNLSSTNGMLWMSKQYSPELAPTNAAQAIIISYSEVQFILAEAAEKGYISGGSTAAASYYLNGVKDQFNYYSKRIPDNFASAYFKLTSASVIPPDSYYTQDEVVYSGSEQQKLEKIWLQKWIAMYMVGYEAWSEWRRTGFPDIPIGPVGPGYIPRRVMYPADEMRINETNYDEAVKWLGADDLKTHVWWDK